MVSGDETMIDLTNTDGIPSMAITESLPMVRNTDGFKTEWNRNKIIDMILKETKLSEIFYSKPAATYEEAEAIAKETESIVLKMRRDFLSGPLIREIVNTVLIDRGHPEWRNCMTRVGVSVHDAFQIDSGYGFEAKDNANQLDNAETSHKRKADKLSKEQNLLLIPNEVSEIHLNGELHIHDLEYFGTRPFCQDWDLRYFLYYGLMPDGVGKQSSIAGPAKKAEVAFLHAVKAMGSAQTNFAGGQGFYNFLTFMAPYLVGKSEEEIEQLMQMFVYEMMQMMCARGGQSLTYNEPLVTRKNGIVNIMSIGEYCHKYIDRPGEKSVSSDCTETLSLNRETGEIEWKPVTAVHIHVPNTNVVKTKLHDGREVSTTSDHSLFELTDDCNFMEISPASKPSNIITVCKFTDTNTLGFDLGLAFLVGVCIGDGNLADNNGTEHSSIRLYLSDDAVRKAVNSVVLSYGKPAITWHTGNKIGAHGSFSTIGIPFVSEIGKGANNKHIPDVMLSSSNKVLFALLDGLLSTDGNVSRNRYEFCTTSKTLAAQVQYIAMKLGLQYCISERSSESNFNRNYPVTRIQFNAQSSRKIKVTNSSRQLDLNNPVGPDQTHHDFSIIRKAVKTMYGNGVSMEINAIRRNDVSLKRVHLEAIADRIPDIFNKIKHVLPSEVKSIEAVECNGFVYDISVQDNENFVLANGIVAHNTVFSSVQLSPGVPKLWRDKPIVAKGHVYDGVQYPVKCTYGKLEREVRLAFKALMNVMLKGDHEGKPFFFPKPEISIEPDFMQEDELFNTMNPDVPTYKELYRMAFELAAKFGTPYFDNQLPAYRGAGDGISCYQCCAYQFSANPTDDKDFDDKLYFREGKHFSMGSWMVMSLNCPRAAYKAEHDDEALFKELKSLMRSAITVFKTKREWMERLIAANRIPFASQRPKDPNTGKPGEIAVDFDALVYTIGIIGINEMVQYHTGYQMHESEEAYKLAIRAMLEMKLYAKELSQKYNMEIALARTPAETTAQRFAVSDLMHEEFKDKAMQVIKGDVNKALEHINETKDLPIYYTNGTHLAPNTSVTITERIQKEQIFFPIVDGGNIMHIWMGEKVPNVDGLMDFGMRIAKNTQVGYFAFTRDMTICLAEGYMSNGLQEKCPKCGSENVQHLSRITGYLQNVEGWNAGKKQELKDRQRYDVA